MEKQEQIKIMEKQEQMWNKKYLELVAYKYKHGRCDVCDEYEDKDLAAWVVEQKFAYRDGNLSIINIKQLRSINFRFKLI